MNKQSDVDYIKIANKEIVYLKNRLEKAEALLYTPGVFPIVEPDGNLYKEQNRAYLEWRKSITKHR